MQICAVAAPRPAAMGRRQLFLRGGYLEEHGRADGQRVNTLPIEDRALCKIPTKPFILGSPSPRAYTPMNMHQSLCPVLRSAHCRPLLTRTQPAPADLVRTHISSPLGLSALINPARSAALSTTNRTPIHDARRRTGGGVRRLWRCHSLRSAKGGGRIVTSGGPWLAAVGRPMARACQGNCASPSSAGFWNFSSKQGWGVWLRGTPARPGGMLS